MDQLETSCLSPPLFSSHRIDLIRFENLKRPPKVSLLCNSEMDETASHD